MADTITKVYSSGEGIIPKFDVTPKIGLAALAVTFVDEKFALSGAIMKSYTSGVGLNNIKKVYR